MPLRPPGALAEAQFLDRCTRCDACLRACTAGIVARGSGGYPEIRFDRGECTFCGDCAAACAPGALLVGDRAFPARAHLGERCLVTERVLCRACGEACEARAIRFDLRRRPPVPQLDPSACNGCGACVRACPASAIEVRMPASPGTILTEKAP